jgi:hypothetical protein
VSLKIGKTDGTLKEYSIHRGVSIPAIKKALAAGRIGPEAYEKTKAGKKNWHYKINFELADKHWLARTDSTMLRQPTLGQRENKPPPRKSLVAIETERRQALKKISDNLIGDDLLPETDPDAIDPNISAAASMVQSNARKAHIAAERAQIELDKEKGNVIDFELVLQIWSEIGSMLRDNLFNIRPRIAALLAAETDEKKVGDMLDHEIRAALVAMADDKLKNRIEQSKQS